MAGSAAGSGHPRLEDAATTVLSSSGMRPEEIASLLTQRPFEPFGLYMSDGSSYSIRHPDQVILTPRSIHIGLPGDNGNARIAQDVVICALVHVTRLGPLPDTSTKT